MRRAVLCLVFAYALRAVCYADENGGMQGTRAPKRSTIRKMSGTGLTGHLKQLVRSMEERGKEDARIPDALEEAGGLRLRISVHPQELVLGRTLRVRYVLSNVGENAVVVRLPTSGLSFYDASGSRVTHDADLDVRRTGPPDASMFIKLQPKKLLAGYLSTRWTRAGEYFVVMCFYQVPPRTVRVGRAQIEFESFFDAPSYQGKLISRAKRFVVVSDGPPLDEGSEAPPNTSRR